MATRELWRLMPVCLLMASALGVAACGGGGVAQFRVLTWNAGNCGDDGQPPTTPGDNNALDDFRIGKFVAEQARLRFANVILLQEITERAAYHTKAELGSEWECEWRPFFDNGLATCVQGAMNVLDVDSFRHCRPSDDPEPPPPPFGTCPDYGGLCYREGFGYLQVQYKGQTITNVHVQLGGLDENTGLPGLARQQIVALHNDIVTSGIVGGDFNWVSPHDCSSLAPNSYETTCNNDWYLATANLGITLVTQPGPDHLTDRHKVDHIATVEKPAKSPGVFRQVLGYGQAHDTCTNNGCADSNLPCSNHCMVHTSFSLPPPAN